MEVGCPKPCGLPALSSTPSGPIREGVAPLTGTSTALSFVMETPDSVVVPVLGPDGVVLAEVAADLDEERVGGTAECGGPMAATVTLPAP